MGDKSDARASDRLYERAPKRQLEHWSITSRAPRSADMECAVETTKNVRRTRSDSNKQNASPLNGSGLTFCWAMPERDDTISSALNLLDDEAARGINGGGGAPGGAGGKAAAGTGASERCAPPPARTGGRAGPPAGGGDGNTPTGSKQ